MGRITLDKVSKRFGDVEVIPPLDLTIEDGEFTVFVGPSGCGKSTLLRLIAGLEDTSGGQIRIDKQDATHVPPAKRGLAMVFQSYALYPTMSVRENIAFGLKIRGMPKDEIQQEVERVADLLQISALLDKKPARLSGGQQQRVAMGRALARRPKIYLFDEPLSNLDAKLRADAREDLLELHRRVGTTTIYVTHDQVEAMTMGDLIVILKDGEIQQVGSPMEVYQQPANKFVGSFIGSPAMNFIDGIIKNGEFIAPGINIDLNAKDRIVDGLEVSLGIRPEDIAINHGNIEAIVIVTEPLGSETIIHVQMGETSLVTKHPSMTTLQTGEKITLQFKSDKIVLFDKATDYPVNI